MNLFGMPIPIVSSMKNGIECLMVIVVEFIPMGIWPGRPSLFLGGLPLMLQVLTEHHITGRLALNGWAEHPLVDGLPLGHGRTSYCWEASP